MNDRPIINFSDAGQKKLAVHYVKSLEGLHYFQISKLKDQRTLSQNAYYWGIVLHHVAAGIREAWGEECDSDRAHCICGREFLTVPVVNRTTGEIVANRTKSTSELSKEQMMEYLDSICLWASESLRTEIPPADPSRRTKIPAPVNS